MGSKFGKLLGSGAGSDVYEYESESAGNMGCLKIFITIIIY